MLLFVVVVEEDEELACLAPSPSSQPLFPPAPRPAKKSLSPPKNNSLFSKKISRVLFWAGEEARAGRDQRDDRADLRPRGRRTRPHLCPPQR
eukprot:2929345-Rhodomonas_salina.1